MECKELVTQVIEEARKPPGVGETTQRLEIAGGCHHSQAERQREELNHPAEAGTALGLSFRRSYCRGSHRQRGGGETPPTHHLQSPSSASHWPNPAWDHQSREPANTLLPQQDRLRAQSPPEVTGPGLR